MIVISKEEIERIKEIQLVWLDRAFDFSVFTLKVKSLFGVDTSIVPVGSTGKNDPLLVKVHIKQDRIGEFLDFFKEYDISKMPPVSVEQKVSWNS